MREIPLTKGQVTQVDDEDFERVISAGRWCMNGRYAYNGRAGTLHRFLMGLPKNRDRSVQVNHINGDPLDNRKCNLRICTPAQNQQNRRQTVCGHSPFKGAHWDSSAGHWLARIRVGGTLKYLGVFNTDVEAAQAYNEAAQEYFGEFARLNDLTDAVPASLQRVLQPRIRKPRAKRERKYGESGYRGVYRNRGKWIARIREGGKVRTIGSFDTPEEAATFRATVLVDARA